MSGGKTALVLAGGGLSGAVYEIGALRAIDDLLIDRTVNDFDIYVGTSAGALVSSFLSNGVSPEAMLKAIDGSDPDVEHLEPRHLFNLNYRDLTSWAAKVPVKLINVWTRYLSQINQLTIFDLIWSMSDTLPTGMYDGLGLENYVNQTLRQLGKSNDFNDLDKKLFVVATELISGERQVFGPGYDDETTVSLAVAASSALPLLYKPIRIRGRDYVDGGLRGNASIDIAIEEGASLVVCINPLVPVGYGEMASGSTPIKDKPNMDHVQNIVSQMLRISTHSALEYHIKQIRRAHPEVDVILIEPRPKDSRLFANNLMSYADRMILAHRGFESATLDLAEDYSYFKQVLGYHGVPITRRLVNEEIIEIQNSGYNPQVIQRILEARKKACGRSKFDTPVCRLTRVLTDLEMTLEANYSK